MSFKIALPVAALALLAACDTVHPQSGSIDPGFGEAVAYAKAVQTVDPDPVYAEDGAQPGDHGEKGAEAVKRYRSDQVKEVDRQATTATTGSGSGPQ